MGFATKASGLLHSHPKPTAAEMAATTQQDKDFVAHFSEQQHTLPPDEILQDPRNKDLGRSSKGLGVRDFKLVRTLGTGMLNSRLMGVWDWGGLADTLAIHRDLCAGVACEAG